MSAPDWEGKEDSTPGEWKALLAPMITITGAAEELRAYVVIAVSTIGAVELRTNLPDDAVAALLRMVTPEVPRA